MLLAGYPYHFQYQNGATYWLFGDTQWESFADDPPQNLTHDSMLRYFDVCASQGFNYVHNQLFRQVRASNGGSDGKFNPAFSDYKSETINPAYFQETDFHIAYANGRGITVGIIPTEGHSAVAENFLNSWDEFPDEATRLRYARYVVARYSAYNVAFIVTTRWGRTRDQAARFDVIGWEIRNNNPHKRMLGIHENHGHTNQTWFYGDPYGKWTTFGDYQQWYGYFPETDMRRQFLGGIFTTPCYGLASDRQATPTNRRLMASTLTIFAIAIRTARWTNKTPTTVQISVEPPGCFR